VRVRCCTICGSDLHTMFGRRDGPAPAVLGHEIVGTIVALGDGPPVDLRGRQVELGDRIVWSVIVACKRCRNCRRDIPQKCVALRKYGHYRMTADWQLNGGLAEYCHLVRGTDLVVVDSSVNDKVIAPASCATATVAAALRTAGEIGGRRVLIIGVGMLGLTASAMCASQDAESVTICDIDPERLNLGTKFGASDSILFDELPQDAKNSFDLILEMSGTQAGSQAALEVADIGAQIVLVGAVLPTESILIQPERIVRRLQSIHGVHNYAPNDLLTAVNFLIVHGDRYPFGELVAESYPLRKVNEAVEQAETSRPPRIAICPSDG